MEIAVGADGGGPGGEPRQAVRRVRRRGPAGVRVAVTGVAVMLAAPIALAGCSPGGSGPVPSEPATSAMPSPSVTPSPAPTVDKPVRPENMSLTDEKGAAAAARYFFELYPYMLATGDFTEWDRMTGETCGYCRSQREGIASGLTSGGSFSATQVLVQIVRSYPVTDGDYPVDLTIYQARTVYMDASGRTVSTVDEKSYPAQLQMQNNGGGWKVMKVLHGNGVAR